MNGENAAIQTLNTFNSMKINGDKLCYLAATGTAYNTARSLNSLAPPLPHIPTHPTHHAPAVTSVLSNFSVKHSSYAIFNIETLVMLNVIEINVRNNSKTTASEKYQKQREKNPLCRTWAGFGSAHGYFYVLLFIRQKSVGGELYCIACITIR